MKPAIEERVISINAEAMMQVPRRVGVAGGMGKLDAIRGAVAGGWINVLITDADAARQLLEPPTVVSSRSRTFSLLGGVEAQEQPA